jgi:transcriptional regulator with XRE-family HTH domain
MLNKELTRAARALLGMTQVEVAQRASVAVRTIADFERGASLPLPRTLRDIQRAFEEMGIEFLFEDDCAVGLRSKKQNIDRAIKTQGS